MEERQSDTLEQLILPNLRNPNNNNIDNNSPTFPNLTFFECGGFNAPVMLGFSNSIKTHITHFLSTHPTITHLRIPCHSTGNACEAGIHCTLNFLNLKPDALPSLRVLEAHIGVLEALALANVTSLLTTVEEVITGDWSVIGWHTDFTVGRTQVQYEGAMTSFSSVLQTLLQIGGLPNVKKFTMTVGPMLVDVIGGSRLNVQQMEMLAEILPEVEEWTGNWNGLCHASEETLSSMFRNFTKLKKIRLHGMGDGIDKGLMRAIATAVPSLQAFCYENPDDPGRSDEWLAIDVIRLTNNRIVFSEARLVDE